MANLERRLSLFSVITISISSMIGSGAFVLPGIGIAITGPSLYLAFILSAICNLPAALSKAELAAAMPASGGTYVYIERTFGPLAGTVAGLGVYLSILLKASFALLGIGTYFTVFSSAPLLPVACSFLAFIIFINIFGVGKVSSFLSIILLITISGLLILSISAIPQIDFKNLSPFMTNGFNGLANATALVFVSFAGVTKVAAIAEEIKSPEKNLPRGIILSLIIVTTLYVMISFILSSVYNYQNIAFELRPIYRLAVDMMGPIAGIVFALIAVLTMVNGSNAGILASSRFPFAMARDKLLPAILGKLHYKYLTPILSILLSGSIIAIIILSFDIAKIAKLASAFMIFIYILENITLVVLRESHLQWYKPAYKSPFYPGLQIFGILSGLALLYAMGFIAIVAVLSIAVPGVIIYLTYSKNQMDRRGVIALKSKRIDLIQDAPALYEDGFCDFSLDGDAQVVVALFGKERSPEMLVKMGLALAEHKHIEVSYVLEIPEQTDLHDMVEEPLELKSIKRRILTMAEKTNESISFDSVVSHDVSKTVFEISQSLHCKWLLLEWKGKNHQGFTMDNPIGWLQSHLHCHLATFKDVGIRYVSKLAILIKDGENDHLAIQTAKHLANEFSASITVFYYDQKSKDIIQKDLDIQFESLKLIDDEKSILSGEDKLSKILAVTNEYDLLVYGRGNHSRMKQLLGTDDDKLMQRAACSVLEVHRAQAGKL